VNKYIKKILMKFYKNNEIFYFLFDFKKLLIKEIWKELKQKLFVKVQMAQQLMLQMTIYTKKIF